MEYRTAEFEVGAGTNYTGKVQDHQLEFDESQRRGTVFFEQADKNISVKDLIWNVIYQVVIILGLIFYYLQLDCDGITDDTCKTCHHGVCKLEECKDKGDIKESGRKYQTCISQTNWISIIVVCLAISIVLKVNTWKADKEKYEQDVKDQEAHFAANPGDRYVEPKDSEESQYE